MGDAEWKKQLLELKSDHTWSAPDGYRIFAGDKGAVRFNFPAAWVVKPTSCSIKFYDREPPDDDCILTFSYLHLPSEDLRELSLAQLVRHMVAEDEHGRSARIEVREVERAGLEIAWTEFRFIDPNERRDAITRLLLARFLNIEIIITFDLWVEDRLRFAAAWNEFLRSLELGSHIEDPTRGESVH